MYLGHSTLCGFCLQYDLLYRITRLSQVLYRYERLMNFHWNLNFKSKAKRILMVSENWDREGFICCPFVCFLVYHWLPCRYLTEGPLIISMD